MGIMIDQRSLTIYLPFQGENSPKIAISPSPIPLFGAPHSQLTILHKLQNDGVFTN